MSSRPFMLGSRKKSLLVSSGTESGWWGEKPVETLVVPEDRAVTGALPGGCGGTGDPLQVGSAEVRKARIRVTPQLLTQEGGGRIRPPCGCSAKGGGHLGAPAEAPVG